MLTLKQKIAIFSSIIPSSMLAEQELKMDSRPNIVFIIADDLGCDDLSCYGNDGVKTPNIQKLSDSGLRFTNAFLTAANSSPSRASIVTGRWPVSNGQTDLATGALPQYNLPFPEFFDGIDYFPQVLNDNGYYTAHSGKWHIGYHWADPTGPAKNGFDLTDGKVGVSGCENWEKILEGRPKDKPFFFWLAAHDPHDPWTAPSVHKLSDVRVPSYIPDTEYMRTELAKYYDEIYRLDRYVGSFVDKLKEEGVYENTLIVFVTDNGRAFWRSKSHIYDAGMKTPLIVSWPSEIRSGQVSDNLVSAIDFAPTFVQLSGGNPNDYTFQGRSIISLLLEGEEAKEVNRYVFSEQNWHGYANHYRSVRDKDGFLYIWNGRPDRSGVGAKNFVEYMVKLNDEGKLTDLQKDPLRFPRDEEEFYNFKMDPDQSNDLVNKKEYRDKLNELRDAMSEWKRIVGDKQASKEVPDWYQRPYVEEKPKKGEWGDAPGTRNFGIGTEDDARELTKMK